MLTEKFKLWVRVKGSVGLVCALLSVPGLVQSYDVLPSTPLPDDTTEQNAQNPVAQPLVPEGIYAIQLTSILKLGSTTDQADAETLLSGFGIEPKNGWISEYPLTPAVLGEIDKNIAMACEQGKIHLSKDDALNRITELKKKLGFDIGRQSDRQPQNSQNTKYGPTVIYGYTDNTGAKHYTDSFDSIPSEYQSKAKNISQSAPLSISGTVSVVPSSSQYAPQLNTTTINNYYQNQGPPAVTYYPPPTAYSYLYSWIAYPFWSTGYYYPGFFLLNNFRRQVVYDNTSYTVSNRAGPVSVAFPSSQGGAGYAVGSTGWFTTPDAQTGARAIAVLHQHQPVAPTGFPNFTTHTDRNDNPTRARISTYGGQPFQQPAQFRAEERLEHERHFREPQFREQHFNTPAFREQHAFSVQPSNIQPFNGQPFNGQPFNAQPFNGQPFNGQPSFNSGEFRERMEFHSNGHGGRR